MYHGFDPYTAQATAADAVITLGAPQSGKRWLIDSLEFSYSADPTVAATLAITDAGNTARLSYVTTGGVGPVVTNTRFSVDGAVVITLSSGGAGISGSINCSARQIA